MTTRQWDGAKLVQARHRKGWSQDELAREARTSVTNISRWERNRNVPNANVIPVLAHALEVDEGSFFHANGSDPDDDEEADQLRQAFDDLYSAVLKFSRPQPASREKETQ